MANMRDVVGFLHGGRTPEELDVALTGLVQAVKETGKGGELVYKIKVCPARPNSDVIETVTLEDDIIVKLPKLPRGEALFFANDEGELARSPFNQADLDFGPKSTHPESADVG